MRLALFLPICLCTLATVALGKSVLGEVKNVQANTDIGLPVENKHDSFFKNLSQAEKEWLMNVAIHYAEVPVVEQPEIPEIEEPSPISFSGGFLPFPVFDETPNELITGMLNGKIPEGWQKEFTSWLRRNYNLTNYNFNHYKRFGTFCPPHINSCPGFGDIGAECCPFG